MGIPSLFKIPGHRTFTYRPRYYDPEKEEREERNREIMREMGISSQKEGEYKPSIRRGSMKGYFHQHSRKARNQSNIRLVIIIIFLLIVSYLILFK